MGFEPMKRIATSTGLAIQRNQPDSANLPFFLKYLKQSTL
jgi:hypothetical protein